MVDTTLAGNGTLGDFTPVQLFAGEADVVTSRDMVKAGLILAQYTVISKNGAGEIVAWNPALVGIGVDYAVGTVTIANAVPAAGDIVTVNGVVFTFAAVPANAHEVLPGANVTAAAANLAAAINADNATQVMATSLAGVVTIRAAEPGADGNAITLAKVFATGANGAVSGATLASGNSSEGRATGILVHAMDTSGTGLNKSAYCPYYIGGIFNHEALVWPAGVDTLAARKAAFEGSNINVEKVL